MCVCARARVCVCQVNTYFSRDAGRTWEEIRKGSYIYEFGDHGALMILADNMQARLPSPVQLIILLSILLTLLGAAPP